MKQKLDFLSMLKFGAILAAFSTCACVMLAFVYSGTSAIIAHKQQADLEAAIMELFPIGDEFKEVSDIKSPDPTVTIESAYVILDHGNILGVAVSLSRASYSGAIKTMVGVSVDGTITGVKILEHSDTPGLGANAASPKYFVDRARGVTFYGQFTGKKYSDPFEVKNDVMVITASTITSRAVSASVKAAAIAVTEWLAGTDANLFSDLSKGAAK
jgi:electron transport complex protein RnfG